MFNKLSLAGAAIVLGAFALPASASAETVIPAAAPVSALSPSLATGLASFDESADYQRYRDRRYYGRDRRYHRNVRRSNRRCDSTEGTVIGALAGGLIGNQVAGRGDRTLGTIIGGVGGAFAGREIDRSGQPNRCRYTR